jgi:hypothetical protein
LAAAVIFFRRTHDDEHSVEHYHRQLHTLEELSSHPTAGPVAEEDNGDGKASFPASAFRVSGTSAVRLTEPGHTIVPPVPPPPVPNPSEPVRFGEPSHGDSQATFMTGSEDPAMHSIDHRPRRLGGPIAAVAGVTVLIVVLVVTGLHSNTPKKHSTSGTSSTVTSAPARSHTTSGAGGTAHHKKSPTTTTTVPPVVSLPTATSPNDATYQIADASYSLALTAKNGECWVSATEDANNSVLFTGILTEGQSHTVSATGPVTIVAGAPAAFAATVNGVAVQLPFGFQAPFTLKFETPGTAAGSTTSTTASTTTTTLG